jgi:competence protein ComEA
MPQSLLSVVALLALAAVVPAAAQQPKATPLVEKPATVVNLNTATVADLEQLPGVGATTAARIVEYRVKRGPFKKIEELMNVQGIGEKSFLKLKAQITVGSPNATSAPPQE